MNKNQDLLQNKNTGILLINKVKGKTSFNLVAILRKLLNVQKIGHAGTLDPFATGVMVLLVGKEYTRLSDRFLNQDKEYIATLCLGIRTDSYDCTGITTQTSPLIPSEEQIFEVVSHFQGAITQTPPMFSAKKVKGKKLYELARKGIEIERKEQQVTVETKILHYEYPYLTLHISCSKGTYIRSIAEDIGLMLGSGAHLSDLCRTRSGPFLLADCIDASLLGDPTCIPNLKFLSAAEIPFLNAGIC